MLIFVNEQPLEVADGATTGDALRVFDAALAEEFRTGRALATDGVGRTIGLDTPLVSGAILRVRRSARRPASAE